MSQNNLKQIIAERVAEVLLDISAIQLNVDQPFTWVSGIKSPVYCDNRKICSYVESRGIIVDAFVELIKAEYSQVETIAGVATGGIPLGILVADRLGLPFIYVRQKPKEHGLKKQVEGDYQEGSKVVLIEDHVSTGGSSYKAIEGILNCNMELLSLISIMTYNFSKSIDLFKEKKITYHSLSDLDIVLDVAKEKNLISDVDRKSVLTFRDDPQAWYKQ